MRRCTARAGARSVFPLRLPLRPRKVGRLTPALSRKTKPSPILKVHPLLLHGLYCSRQVGVASAVEIDEAFEPKYGMPVVRERVSYGQLLEDIRTMKVREIHWFSQKDDCYFEGPCLVEYRDDTVKQSVVPARDMRIPAAMMAHRVKGSLLPPVPSESELNPVTPLSEDLLNLVAKTFPVASLVLVYLAVRYMAWLKGDTGDRHKIRQREREAAAKQKSDELQESRESEAEVLANMGMGVKEIVAELRESKIKFDLYHVKQLVDRAQLRAAQAEAAKTKAKPPPDSQKKPAKQQSDASIVL